jgi:hypothetical protein
MNSIDQINQKVIELWLHTFHSNADVFMPLIYPPIKKNAILFIGLNPSFNLQGFRSILKDSPYSHINPEDFYHLRNRAKFKLEIAQDIEQLAKNKYPYFAKFKEIAKYTKMDWEHVDLFFYRQTRQSNFKKMVYSGMDLNEFGRSQLQLSRELISVARPKVIVVANALASKVFSKEYNAQFSEEYGYHIIILNGQVIPVLLGSMFTGQRAMDVYSYQRLRWHIKQAITHIKQSND